MRPNALQQILYAIDVCLKQRLTAPTLTLLYSGIDTMAWLNCPAGQEEGTRRDFLDWVESYLLPNSGLPCTALELYSARCGIVHTQSPEARATRHGTARKVFYSWGSCRPDALQAYIDIADPGAAVAVDIELVVKAFVLAVDRFVKESETSPDLAERVEQRLRRIFCDIGPDDLPALK